jgi:amino acid permease
MEIQKKRLLTGIAILVGTCIGAGVLGIPYVAAQSGFVIALVYIILIGILILTVNLYLGEISLRTKGKHQLPGYAKKYLGKRWRWVMEFATIFGIYAAIIAYLFGMGESLSFLFFQNAKYTTIFGVCIGLGMSGLLWRGMKSLKKFEKIGVAIILSLLVVIFVLFAKDVSISNLNFINMENVFLPFGVILFALMSFHAIPEINLVLKKNKPLMKKVLFNGTFISIIFYILFALVVVGAKGLATPEIATLALGPIFILLGILTMFTSYLSLGNALEQDFQFDDKMPRKRSWFLASIVPIFLFLLLRFSDFFSFTKILSIGGVVAGGLTAILILLMVKKSKAKGDRIPEYSMPVNWFVIGFLILIFLLGVVREVILALR